MLIDEINGDNDSIDNLAQYLGYSVGHNPVNEKSDWRILLTDKLLDNSKGVIAAKPVSYINNESTTIEIRKLYKQVIQLREELSLGFEVQVVAFVGINRLIFFPFQNGNRDTRLDIVKETSDKALYIKNLNMLKNENIKIVEDEFGFGEYEIRVSNEVFKQTLSNHFLTVVAYYRKKLSELITSSNLKYQLYNLMDDKAKYYLKNRNLVALVEEKSYTAVLSNVVDTIILRQLMRRFLEGYYGSDAFNVGGIALGIGGGTMDEAINSVVSVEAAIHIGDEDEIKKLNRKKKEIHDYEQLDLFADNFFDEAEQKATSYVELKDESKERIKELTKIATQQFRTVYNGDLFAGSVGNVADEIEKQMAEEYPEFIAKLWMDTSAQEYSFRYEDMPPEAIEKQYENSMSQNVQIKIEAGDPVVYYGDNLQEQKKKGAYYTDERFVQYMVKQTVEVEFNNRYQAIKEVIFTGNDDAIREKINHLLDMKVADLTAGGGSFLRGTFLLLAGKQALLSTLELSDNLLNEFPFFSIGDEAIYLWEKYILENMIYGVDIDYKAIIISSLTLTLSSLEHRPKDIQLPSLIGRNLIHQNSLINSVPYYLREEIYSKYKGKIKKLRKYKIEDFPKFLELRNELQRELLIHVNSILQEETAFLHVEAIEINLPEVFFEEDGSLKKDSGFDVVIGNPPWEIWKPNSNEFYSQYDENYLSLEKKTDKKNRQKELEEQFPTIRAKWSEIEERYKKGSKYFRSDENFKYQSWIVENRKTSSDINLYKISLERFLQLLKDQQKLSIIIPDNLMTDLGSTGLRHLIFDKCKVEEFLSFENTKKIFKTVDSRYKFAVLSLTKGIKSTESFKVFFYKQMLDDLQNETLKLNYPLELVRAELEKYSLFEPRTEEEFQIYRKIKLKFPTLLETKLFKLGNDFHKTNDSALFRSLEKSEIPLYEGKLINQFTLTGEPTEGLETVGVKKKVGEDYKKFRIAIRTIARESDKRALIATLLPRNTVAANSLSIQKNVNDSMICDQLFYLGMLNSYVIDFVLRKLITTNVNQTYLKQLPVPRVSDFNNSAEIICIVKNLLSINGEMYDELSHSVSESKFDEMSVEQLIAELNARVCYEFGLSRSEIISMMKSFESANHRQFVQEESQRIIDVYDELIIKLGENG